MEHRRGLTLIEVLAALAVLAAIAALALPALGSRLSAAKVEMAAAQLDAAVTSARRAAMQEGAPVSLFAAEENSGTWLRLERPRAGGTDDRAEHIASRPLSLLPAGVSVRVDCDDAGRGGKGDGRAVSLVMCLPDGLIEIPARVSVLVGGSAWDLAVNPWTGATNLVPPRPRGGEIDSEDVPPTRAVAP